MHHCKGTDVYGTLCRAEARRTGVLQGELKAQIGDRYTCVRGWGPCVWMGRMRVVCPSLSPIDSYEGPTTMTVTTLNCVVAC